MPAKPMELQICLRTRWRQGKRKGLWTPSRPHCTKAYKDDIAGDLQDIEIYIEMLRAHILSNTRCKRRDHKTCSGPMSFC